MTVVECEISLTLYVYYKIPTDKHQHYLSAVAELNNNISKLYPSLKMSRQKRPEVDAENRELWMEVYQGIANDKLTQFTSVLTKLAEKNGLPKERRHEIFIPL